MWLWGFVIIENHTRVLRRPGTDVEEAPVSLPVQGVHCGGRT